MPSILVKSLAFDLLDTYLNNFTDGFGGFRRFEFYLAGVKYLFPGTGLTVYIDPAFSVPSGSWPVTNGFNTSLPVDDRSGYGFLTTSVAFLGSPLRIIVVFDTPIELDGIVFNNWHDYGGNTVIGIKSLVVTATEETLGQSDVDSPINIPSSLPGAVEIFNGQVLEHTSTWPSDIRDDQVLALNFPEPAIGVELDAVIELFGGFTVLAPAPNSVEFSAILELFGGFEIDIDRSVEMSAAIELFGGFEIDIDRSVEMSAAIELFGGFEIENLPLVSIEMSAAIELFGGFEVSADKSVEFSAIIELFGGFNVHIDATECRLPKFNQNRWC